MLNLKNLGFLTVTAIAFIGLSGCETEVVVSPAPHCANEPVEVCHDYRDFNGYFHRECRTEIHQRCWEAATALGNPVGAVGLARDYSVSFDAAEKIIHVAVSANKGDTSPAAEQGLSSDDMENLAHQQLPTDAGIDAVAKNLNQDRETIRNLFSGMIEETKQNQAATNSFRSLF